MISKRCLRLVVVVALCVAPALAQDLPPVTDHKIMAFQARARRHPTEYSAFKPLVEEAQRGNRDALSALIELARDPQTAWHATSALSDIGPAALPAMHVLRSLLNEIDDPAPRSRIVRAIGEIGPAAEPAVGDLAEILRSEPNTCPNAADALARIGRSPGIAVPALVWALENSGIGCRMKAIEALGNFQTMPAVEALATVLEDDYVGIAALESLGRIGPLAATAENEIAVLLYSENKSVRSAAENTMTLITGRPSAADVFGDLRRAIISISDNWYSDNRDGLHFDRVCVSSEPVEGLFEASVGVDLNGARADAIRFDDEARRVVAAELDPLAEILRQNGFPVRINPKPCFDLTSSAPAQRKPVREVESN